MLNDFPRCATSTFRQDVQDRRAEDRNHILQLEQELSSVKDEAKLRLISLKQEFDRVKAGYEEQIANVSGRVRGANKPLSRQAAASHNGTVGKVPTTSSSSSSSSGGGGGGGSAAYWQKKIDHLKAVHEKQIRQLKRGEKNEEK